MIATVIATDGQIATVEVERTSACEGCHKNEDGKGCSGKFIGHGTDGYLEGVDLLIARGEQA